jgi:hypothetical protein
MFDITDLASLAWGIVVGVIVSLIVYVIVTLIPIQEKTRYKVIFYRRKLSKFVLNPAVKVSYSTKTQNLEEKGMLLEEFVRTIQQKLVQNKFVFKGTLGSTSNFQYIFGTTEIEIALTPSYVVRESETNGLVVDYLQCDFKLIDCRYRNFNGHLLDLIQTLRKLEMSLEDVVGRWLAGSLTCEIKRLYKFVGVLKDLKMSSLMGKIGGLYEIELFEKSLIVYGDVETKMSSMIKDIITYYY